jgi:selenocysteine lyase/cysteine desulfurase
MSPEERAWTWLVNREIEDRFIQEHESHAASLAQLLQDYGDQRAREALSDAADALQERKHIAQRRAYEAEADDIPFLPRATEALKRVAMVWESAETIVRSRSLAHKERPR